MRGRYHAAVVHRSRSLAGALAFAGGIAVVVAVAQVALAGLALSRAAALSVDALASAATLGLAAGAVASLGEQSVAERLGLRRGRLDARQIALAMLGIVAFSHAMEAALELAGIVSPGLTRFDDALGGLDLEGAIFPLLALSLGSAFGEELFFRGLVQRGLAPRIGVVPAIGVGALAFGAAHGDWAHGAAAALLGVFLGVVTHAAGSIRPAIAAHATNNAVALVEKVADLQLPSGSLATPALLVAALTLACVALVGILRPSRRALQSPSRPSD